MGFEAMDIGKIPWITTSQMIEVDRLMVEKFGIGMIQMMENAGRNLARLAADRFLDSKPATKSVGILAGSGGNGGGALVAARFLHNWGAAVAVILTRDIDKLSDVTRIQAGILERMGISLATSLDEIAESRPDLILDGLIGYSLLGQPRGKAAELISWANEQPAPVLALDLPSGVDATSGEVCQPSIVAEATMTLALPKKGLQIVDPDRVGELYLADIGVPPQLYCEPGLDLAVPQLFQGNAVLRLR